MLQLPGAALARAMFVAAFDAKEACDAALLALRAIGVQSTDDVSLATRHRAAVSRLRRCGLTCPLGAESAVEPGTAAARGLLARAVTG